MFLVGRSVLSPGVILKALSAFLDRAFAEFARDEQLDGSLHVLAREGRLTPVDHKHAALAHQVVKRVSNDRVHGLHRLGRDADLLLVRANLFENSEDIGVEGVRIAACLGLLP